MAEQSSDRQSHALSSLLNEAIWLLGASGSEGTDRSQRVAENSTDRSQRVAKNFR